MDFKQGQAMYWYLQTILQTLRSRMDLGMDLLQVIFFRYKVKGLLSLGEKYLFLPTLYSVNID